MAAELPIGTALSVRGRAGHPEDWYHVSTDEGREGWILGRLTAPLDRAHPEQTIESIVAERLSSDLNVQTTTFSTHVQLVDLIERTASSLEDREERARFALYRLRAMSNAFHNVPFGRGDTDPYRSWIADHRDAARYNEPAGQWMVDPPYVLKVHGQYQDAAAADDIAWFFVQNGVYGECEGDVPCYVAVVNRLDGEYIRLHAHGRHVDESLADVATALNGSMDNLQQFPAVLAEFDPTTRCGELHSALDPLVAAVRAVSSTRKAATLAALDRYNQLCR